MGRAEDLFDRLGKVGEDAIDELISIRQSEEPFLDFKRSADNGSGRHLHDIDRNNLAKAISGFGNSEGGVIVWGVECQPKADIGDVASSKKYIQNPQRFVSWLEGAVSGCTIPPHPGVRHICIIADTTSGFAVTYIPKSHLVPHQCLRPLQYYIRAGSDFVPTPHAVLMGLFGRPPQPFVFHMWSYPPARLVDNGQGYPAIECDVDFRLGSHGPSLARGLYVNLQILPPKDLSSAAFIPVDPTNWSYRHSLGRMTNLVANDSFKLAPMATVSPVTLKLKFIPPFNSDFIYELTFGHESSPISKMDGRLTPIELQNAYETFVSASQSSRVSAGHEFVETVMRMKDKSQRKPES
jgi:hypothetical protein